MRVHWVLLSILQNVKKSNVATLKSGSWKDKEEDRGDKPLKEKGKSCDECKAPLKDKNTFHHGGKNYCVECMTVHIED